MRLPNDALKGAFALGLTVALAGCGMIGGGKDRPVAVTDSVQPAGAMAASGPAADYPMVLGEPFTVDGELYTPADTASYDAVGYAALDREGGQGVTAAHKTLPLPSYVEVTSLDTGKTILVRVERRGPMTGSRLIALSPGARAQLGGSEGTAVRVRRVNPPEVERAELRAGKAAPERMATPKTLLTVLQRKLPVQGEASLRSAAAEQARTQGFPSAPASSTGELPPVNGPVQQVAVAPAKAANPVASEFDQAFRKAPAPIAAAAPPPAAPRANAPKAVTSYPLAPLESGRVAAATPPVSAAPASRAPVRVHRGVPPGVQAPSPATVRPFVPAPAPAPAPAVAQADDGFVVQAAAFSSKASAENAAGKIGGFVMQAGKYFRVRTGPYTTRGQAEAALAKVRAAGYSDARVFTAG